MRSDYSQMPDDSATDRPQGQTHVETRVHVSLPRWWPVIKDILERSDIPQQIIAKVEDEARRQSSIIGNVWRIHTSNVNGVPTTEIVIEGTHDDDLEGTMSFYFPPNEEFHLSELKRAQNNSLKVNVSYHVAPPPEPPDAMEGDAIINSVVVTTHQ